MAVGRHQLIGSGGLQQAGKTWPMTDQGNFKFAVPLRDTRKASQSAGPLVSPAHAAHEPVNRKGDT